MTCFGRCRARAWLELNTWISIKVYTFIVLFVQPRPRHFKASHWLRVRGKVLQWLFPRTTVQFYLLMSPPKLPWNLSKLVMQILTMAECMRKCQVFLYLPREWSMTPMLFGQWHKCSLTGQAIALGCAQYTSTLELSSAFSAKTQQRAWLPNIQI